MKIRQGFVSNSSSSSFVVAFTREPKSVDDVKEMMFAERQEFSSPWNWEDKYWPTEDVAITIWNAIQNQKSNQKTEMLDSIRHGWFEIYGKLKGHADYNYDNDIDWNTEEGRQKYNDEAKKRDNENEKRAKAILKQFMKDNSDATFYVFEFSDNDGSYFSALEHGNVFRKLNHIQTSYH